MMSLQTSVTMPLSIDKDFGCYVSKEESVGTFKSVHLSVDDTRYNLSADAPTDVKFEDGSKVKVVIGENAEIWSGTCEVDSGKVQFEVNRSSYYCNLGVEAAGIRILNDFVYGSLGSGSAGLLKSLTSGEMVNGVHRVEDGLYLSWSRFFVTIH